MNTTTTGVPVSDLCPTWCRTDHGELLVPDGEGSAHYAEPVLDEYTATVQVTCWVDNRAGVAVPEASEVLVNLPETILCRLQVLDAEAVGVEQRAAGALSTRTAHVIRGLLDQQGIPLSTAAARLELTEDDLRARLAGPLLVSDLYDLALLVEVAPHTLVAQAQAQLDTEGAR